MDLFFQTKQVKTEKGDSQSDVSCVKQLEFLIRLLIHNPSIITLQTKNIVSQKVADIVTITEQSLLDGFRAGRFDEEIFSKDPKFTEELETIIKLDNRAFIQRLFAKCKFEETLKFWLSPNRAQLPTDSEALAVALRSKKFVFEYLYDIGLFKDICEEDKIDFLRRATGKLDSDSFDYLKQILNIDEKLESNI